MLSIGAQGIRPLSSSASRASATSGLVAGPRSAWSRGPARLPSTLPIGSGTTSADTVASSSTASFGGIHLIRGASVSTRVTAIARFNASMAPRIGEPHDQIAYLRGSFSAASPLNGAPMARPNDSRALSSSGAFSSAATASSSAVLDRSRGFAADDAGLLPAS